MRWFAIIPLFCFAINIVIWTLVYAQPKRTRVNTAYLMLANCFILWEFADIVMLSAPPVFWTKIILKVDPVLWGSIGFLALNFAYALMGRKRDIFFYLSLAGIPAIVLLSAFTDLVYSGIEKRPWGYHEIPGPAMVPAVTLTVLIPTGYALILATRTALKSASEATRRSLFLLVAGGVATLVLGTVSEVILPHLGPMPFPEFGPSLTIIMSFFVYRAVVRHNFLMVKVEEAAMDIFEATPVGIAILSADGNSVNMNKAASKILGMIDPAQPPASFPPLARLIEQAVEEESVLFLDLDGYDDAMPAVSATKSPIVRAGEHVGELLIFRDVTREQQADRSKQRLESQLRQSQKMEAIGTLAGGVAHDMNNVLAGIMGFASVIESEMKADDPLVKDVREIISCAGRGKDLTSDLLGFARKGKYRKQRIDLHRTAREVLPLLKRTVSKKIEISHDAGDGALEIEGDPNQISHVIMNLCINAADAMPGGGDLTISTEGIDLPGEARAEALPLPDGQYARLRVSDTGSGMTREVADRAFEPFFTTKEQGEGTGLGLSMVYGTVANHGGAVWLDSREGEGTRITVVFPRLDPVSEERRVSSAPPLAATTEHKGVVLLVDDEELVRNSGRRMLVHLGYGVLLAKDGREALEIYSASGPDIDAVLLDMAMPTMDGAECFDRLMEVDPKVRVIISSGFALGESTASMIRRGARAFLPKPFEMTSLGDVLARTIDSTRR